MIIDVRKNPTRRDFYVYVLLDPRKPGHFKHGRWKFSYEPFYVGKGSGNRVLAHVQRLRSTKACSKLYKILKILTTGQPILFSIKKRNLTEKAAFNLEILLISKIGRKDTCSGPLTNHTDGGDGRSAGFVTPTKTRKKMSNTHKKIHASMSDEQKAGVSSKISRMWSSLTDEYREEINSKRSSTMKALYATPEHKQRLSESTTQMNLNRTPQQRKKYAKQASKAAKNWWKNATPQQLFARAEKRRETFRKKRELKAGA
jgi:hypothetical protein